MAITARDLAHVEALGLRLAAGAGAADREITWAHAIELADPTPYLSGGELVMTTGINIGADAAAQTAYVRRLVAVGIAALAVDTGTTISDVPAAVLAAGDELGLPVLVVPPATPFIAITRVVIDSLRADELRSVQRVVDQQRVLARATLRGGIPGAVSALADCLPAAVVVTDAAGKALAAAGSGHLELVAALSDSQPAALRRTGGYVTFDGQAYVSVTGLRAARTVRGHLGVRTAEPLTNSERLLVAHAVSLISIAAEKPARVAEAEQRLRTAVTRELISGSGNVDSGVLRYFGFEPGADVVVLVLNGLGPVLDAERNLGAVLDHGGPYLMTLLDDEIVAILPTAASRRRVQAVAEALAGGFPPGSGGGVSSTVRFAGLGLGMQQARTAARCRSGSAIGKYDDLGAYGVLLAGRSPDELRVLAGLLRPLTDAGEADENLATLTAFLQHHGQMAGAAAELGVHRHTLRNRMRRICALLSDDLESADSRAQLWLALQARQLIEDQPNAGGAQR
ncbi:PucR family transcriptional regulator [Mycolicibacterium sarraceniae]|uniref:PucR family transcriptional regulator n=1 Tax=Mycolicibacterium sarraceniae TaxID=1534348 RepID=A0A7I7SJX6_9MYCO|nr:PucR family transcriptional regulator [Mycolicibacterium sarraceniae]BBY57254.1 hypothetical protein MSAR_03900 [Mycolicibacterium sarraceniae]